MYNFIVPSPDQLHHFHPVTLHDIQPAVPIVSVDPVFDPCPLQRFFHALLMAHPVPAEVGEHFVFHTDSRTCASDPQDQIPIVMDRLVSVLVILIDSSRNKGGRMVPIPRCDPSAVLRPFDKTLFAAYDPQICIEQVVRLPPVSLHSTFHCVWFIPVIAVDDPDQFSRCHVDPLVHRIVHS